MSGLSDRTTPGPSYQVVVVGSGYGGSVLAARLAQKGLEVGLIERGREWQDGNLPSSLLGAARELMSGDNPLGLFDYRAGTDVDVLSASGLGGTSLINGNVALRAEAEAFDSQRWPTALRGKGAAVLAPYYTAAEGELRPVCVPDASALPKIRAREISAKKRGLELELTPLTIRFPKDRNSPEPGTCTQCGNCIIGCGEGAKGALTTSYLLEAKKAGAARRSVDIVTQTEVRFVLPNPAGGWQVHTRSFPEGGGPPEERVVLASVVVLAAGSLGSTGILLRSRARGLSVGDRVGHHFGGNADRAGYGYNCDVRVGAIGRDGCGHGKPDVGPTIASLTRHKDHLGRTFLLEEGAVPRPLLFPTRAFLPAAALLRGEDTDTGVVDKAKELARILRDQLGVSDDGALAHTMLMLAMGDDDADGRVILDEDENPRVVWGALPEKRIFAEMDKEMRALVADLGGTWVPNPNPWRAFGGPPMTVHPLGGLPMGDDAGAGAVDHLGRVFDEHGELHPWLFVADGAIVPSSLRVNPLLTITALAERIAAEAGFEHAPPCPKPVPPPPIPTPPIGIGFTEEMSGWIDRSLTTLVDQEQFLEADRERRGSGAGAHPLKESLSFRLTIVVDALDAFLLDPAHEAPAEGHVEWGGKHQVETGRFNLLVDDTSPNTKLTKYRLTFLGEEGEALTLEGEKRIHDDAGYDSFADATTLYVTIRSGWAPGGPVVAQGVLRIEGKALFDQLASMRAYRSPRFEDSISALAKFGEFFFGNLWEPFVRPHLGTSIARR